MTVETLKWLIDKQEELRTNNISRAGVIATISTIILAAYAFLSERASTILVYGFRSNWSFWDPQFLLVDAPIVVGLALTCLALFLSLDAISHFLKGSRKTPGKKLPVHTLLHSRETIEVFKTWEAFDKDLASLTEEEFAKRLSAELWSIHHAHARAYDRLRVGAWLVFATAVLLTVQYVAVVVLKLIR